MRAVRIGPGSAVHRHSARQPRVNALRRGTQVRHTPGLSEPSVARVKSRIAHDGSGQHI